MIKILPILLLITLPIWGNNPFLVKTKKKSPPVANTETVQPVEQHTAPSFWVKGKKQLFKWQSLLRNRLAKFAKTIKENASPSILILSFLMALLYGLLHAIGPGHGKIFAISYFLSRRSTLKKGVLLGSGIAFFHALSAVVLVGVIYFVMKVSLATTTSRAEMLMQPISYGAITLLGLFLLITHIVKIIKKGSETEAVYNPDDNRSLLMMAVAVGMVPCPATTFILLFAIAIDLIWFGFYLTLAVALGMGITISMIGMITILLHNRGKQIDQNQKPGKLHTIIELIGALMIVSIGGFLLLTTMI